MASRHEKDRQPAVFFFVPRAGALLYAYNQRITIFTS